MSQGNRIFYLEASVLTLILSGCYMNGYFKKDEPNLEIITITASRYNKVGSELDTKENFIGEFTATIRSNGKSDLKYRKSLAQKLVPVAKPAIAPLKRDKAKEGWTLLEDVPFDGKRFVPELVEFLKQGESSVNGEVMRQRAKELNAYLGQRHAEYLLEHQELISKEWRGNYFLVFPGTVWRFSSGVLRVPCLHWHDGRWYLIFRWHKGDWDSSDRFVRSRKPD